MRASSAALLLVLGACRSTEPSHQFIGNFASPLRDRTSYLAFQIYGDESGHLSGRAWSSYSSTLLAGVTLSGTRTGSDIVLGVHPRPPLGILDYRFDGVLAGDTLKGIFSFPGGEAQQVEMPRVSTIPLGDYVIVATGSETDSTRGFSTFNYGGGSFRLVQVHSVPDRSVMVVTWGRRDLPAPGRYPVSPEGGEAPSVRFVYTTATGAPEATYLIRSGVITIQQAERYVLVGRYLMTVADSTGRILRLTGVFNSGCTGNAC